MSWTGMCSATETTRGMEAVMAERIAAAAEGAGTNTAEIVGFKYFLAWDS